MTENEPSQFWQQLGAQHADALNRHGFEQIKRRQAARYFSWQWRWRRLPSSEQFRFLVRHTSPRSWVDILREPMDLEDRSWAGTELGAADRTLTTVAVRLLWRYAERFGDPDVLSLREPTLGAPLPIQFRGRLISQDLANTSLEVAAIRRALAGQAPSRILEVGAGYGRTAHALLSIFPDCEYTIVDIEPAISISAWYLGNLVDPARVRFVKAEAASPESVGRSDLAMSISSLQEMTPEQVRHYVDLFDQVCEGGGTVYLKQWERWSNPDDHVVMEMANYPVPQQWRRLAWERAPVQTKFIQAAWAVPAAGESRNARDAGSRPTPN